MNMLRRLLSKTWLCTVALLVLAAAGIAACTSVASVQVLSAVQVDSLRMQADAGRDDTALTQLRSAARWGNVHAQRALGTTLLNRATDLNMASEGLQSLGKAANANDVDAQLLLGKTYLQGTIFIKPDYALARQWLGKAVAQQDKRAAYYLGLMDLSGYGGPIDHSASVRWLQTSADAGLPNAMFLLGNAYAAGKGAPQDRRSALHWYMRAAALEHPLALQEIAYAFQNGNSGLPRSEFQASQMMRGVDHALRHVKAAP